MCFGFESFCESVPPPKSEEALCSGAGATLAALLDTTVRKLSKTTEMDATGQMNVDDIVQLYRKGGYIRAAGIGHIEVAMTDSRADFKKNLIGEFTAKVTETELRKKMNLRMKMPVGWMYKRARTDPHGQKVWGQVVALRCWLDQDDGEVAYGLVDYRDADDDPQGKQIRLPREDEVTGYWSLSPIFYFSTQVVYDL